MCESPAMGTCHQLAFVVVLHITSHDYFLHVNNRGTEVSKPRNSSDSFITIYFLLIFFWTKLHTILHENKALRTYEAVY